MREPRFEQVFVHHKVHLVRREAHDDARVFFFLMHLESQTSFEDLSLVNVPCKAGVSLKTEIFTNALNLRVRRRYSCLLDANARDLDACIVHTDRVQNETSRIFRSRDPTLARDSSFASSSSSSFVSRSRVVACRASKRERRHRSQTCEVSFVLFFLSMSLTCCCCV